MSRSVVYLQGRFVPRARARLDIEDRGTLFGDGVYEVLRYYAGRPVALDMHVARLQRSLAGIAIEPTPEVDHLPQASAELLQRQGLTEAKVYWQVTRGAGPRSHDIPEGIKPTVLALASAEPPLDRAAGPRAIAAVTHPDERWHHCWIKSLMLLPNVLARRQAKLAGGDEAILHRAGVVTEGASTSVLAVRAGEVWTHPADQWILPGVTRAIVLDLARAAGIPVREQTFTVEELRASDELMTLGTTTLVSAVTRLDGRPVGAGVVGPVTLKLHALLVEHILRDLE